MNVEIRIDENEKETKLIIVSNKLTDEVAELKERLENTEIGKTITGVLNEQIYLLKQEEIESFFTENTKVYARVADKKYKISKKLYEIEELLKNSTYVRISNSEIANFDKVEALEVIGRETICLTFKSGETTYVSRRNIKKIKEYLGI